MGTIFGREPAAILAVIQAGIALAIGFGLHWTGEQVSLVVTFTAVILGLITRQVVTPTANPKLDVGTRVNTGDGGAGVVRSA